MKLVISAILVIFFAVAAQANSGLREFRILKQTPDYKLMVKKEVKVKLENFDEVNVPPYTQFANIDRRLYLTSVAAITKDNMHNFEVEAIFDFAKEFEYEMDNVDHHKYKNFSDSPDAQIESLFDEVADGIHKYISKNQSVVVHCFAGCSRSAIMVLAYMVKHRNYTVRDAFKQEKKQRWIVRPNNGFFEQLLNFEKKIKGQSSGEMITIKQENVEIVVPSFFKEDYPDVVQQELVKAKEKKEKEKEKKKGTVRALVKPSLDWFQM